MPTVHLPVLPTIYPESAVCCLLPTTAVSVSAHELPVILATAPSLALRLSETAIHCVMGLPAGMILCTGLRQGSSTVVPEGLAFGAKHKGWHLDDQLVPTGSSIVHLHLHSALE